MACLSAEAGGGIGRADDATHATFALRDVPFATAVERVAKRFGYRVVFERTSDRSVTLTGADLTLDDALATLVTPPLRYRVADKTIVVLGPAPASAALVPLVLKPRVLPPDRAAQLVAGLFPDVRTAADARTGSVIVFARKSEADAIKSTFDSLDAKGPSLATAQAFPLHVADPARLAATLRRLFPAARIEIGPNRTLIAVADAQALAEMTTIVQSVDAATPAPSLTPRASDAVAIAAARPRDVARAVGAVVPGVHADVAGQSVVFSGSQDAVAQAKALASELDLPNVSARYTQVYRLKYVDAGSVVSLLRREFPSDVLDLDPRLNAFSALATRVDQNRIADAVAQVDTSVGAGVTANGIPVSQPGTQGSALAAGNGTVAEVVTLRAATPGTGQGGASTSSSDLATGVQNALSQSAPDLHITIVPNNASQLILTGSEASVALAKSVISQLDVAQKLVVLDTEILEVDENSAKNLGFSLGANPVISTVYTEETPAPGAAGISPALQGLQALARTPFTFTAQLNLLVSKGNARILANPRISTISGRTATIRAGENIAILTTTGGGVGTAATTQLQTFQTGVSLDITPVINADDFITVLLHPVVNSLSGTTNGVPQISTRDTQTTVGMKADQTLVIGGLIEDDTTRNEVKIPLLGDLPLVGKAFRDTTVNTTRNELVITVTPHILYPGQANAQPPQATLGIPVAQELPTISPATVLRPSSGVRRARRAVPTYAPAYAAPSPTPVVALGEARTPIPTVTTPAPAVTPTPFGAPQAAGPATPAALFHSPEPSPVPTPSAFAQTNTFTYGSAPQNNAAQPGDAVQIFYASLTPTVLKNNTQVTVSAITTTNAQKVTLGAGGGGFTTALSQVGNGQWQASYPFSTLGLSPVSPQTTLTLTATRFDGATSTVSIPVSIQQ